MEEDLDWLAVKFEVARFLLSAAVVVVDVVVDVDVGVDVVDEGETDRTVVEYTYERKKFFSITYITTVKAL